VSILPHVSEHRWHYFPFKQLYLAKGKIAQAVLLPHEAKYNTQFYIGRSGLDRTHDFQKFGGSGLDWIQFCRSRTGLGLKNFTIRSSLLCCHHQRCTGSGFQDSRRQDSAHFQQTGSDPDYVFFQLSGSGSGFSNIIVLGFDANTITKIIFVKI